MKKKITIVGLNYYPEDTAIGLYSTQLTQYLSEHDFKVEVLTGFPYYPAWEIAKDYVGKSKFLKESLNDITIYRYRQYVPKKPTFLKRILLLIDFTFGCIINSFKIKETDLVIAIVPFTSAIFVARLLAKRKKAKLWVHIQDFEFDAAAETDLVQNKNKLFKVLFWMERKLLNKADAVSTISNAMLQKLNKKITKKVPTYLLPNWVDVNQINPLTSSIHPFLTSEKFKILYSGNIGEKQDWHFFLKVVDALKNENIEFVVVGSGSKKDWLVDKIKSIKNVAYYPPVAYKDLSNLLCSADLHILFQKDNVIDTVMPSKILGMMASAKPSIITGNLKSEVAEVMHNSKGGNYMKSDDLKGVINTIIQIKNSQNNMGTMARDYVIANFSSKEILSKFNFRFKSIL